jgi:hypothetical protein
VLEAKKILVLCSLAHVVVSVSKKSFMIIQQVEKPRMEGVEYGKNAFESHDFGSEVM